MQQGGARMVTCESIEVVSVAGGIGND